MYILFLGQVLQSKRPLDRTASAAILDPNVTRPGIEKYPVKHGGAAGSNPAAATKTTANSNYNIKQEIVQSNSTYNNSKAVKGSIIGPAGTGSIIGPAGTGNIIGPAGTGSTTGPAGIGKYNYAKYLTEVKQEVKTEIKAEVKTEVKHELDESVGSAYSGYSSEFSNTTSGFPSELNESFQSSECTTTDDEYFDEKKPITGVNIKVSLFFIPEKTLKSY